MNEGKYLRIHPGDSVMVALEPLAAGRTVTVDGRRLTLREDVPAGHKFALRDHRAGEKVIKYGYPIGRATQDIPAGAPVHTHNLASALEKALDYTYHPQISPPPRVVGLPLTFKGYLRENGDAGIRNEIWIINTVGCVNKTAETLARLADERFRGDGVDGVFHFAHPYGCSQLGGDLAATQRILSGLVGHPNAAGVLVLGLGCENNHLEVFRPLLGEMPPERVKFLNAQEAADEIEAGMSLLAELVQYARRFERRDIPVAGLRVGLKCGGSDGFSGITANPLVGLVSDYLVAAGGTAVLTEVPEMFGAETILMNRAESLQTFAKIVSLINDFKTYYVSHGQEVYENPSPGNKAGGITTLEEKSLGCIQKGGGSPVTDVVEYGGRVRRPGLNLLQGPGNDMVSVTALAAAGAQLILFTTGRGTPLGGPVPTLKIATNSALFDRKKNWLDFNAGALLEGGSMSALAGELYRLVVATASGEYYAQNERSGYREIAIFKDGVIL